MANPMSNTIANPVANPISDPVANTTAGPVTDLVSNTDANSEADVARCPPPSLRKGEADVQGGGGGKLPSATILTGGLIRGKTLCASRPGVVPTGARRLHGSTLQP